MKDQVFGIKTDWARLGLSVLAAGILACAYLFQTFDFLALTLRLVNYQAPVHPNITFIVNKTLRLIINDLACCVLVFAIFGQKKYLRAIVWVFVFELFILLPVYFLIKLSIEGDSEISSPLLSQLHRLIINPLLMILMIIAFIYQRFMEGKRS